MVRLQFNQKSVNQPLVSPATSVSPTDLELWGRGEGGGGGGGGGEELLALSAFLPFATVFCFTQDKGGGGGGAPGPSPRSAENNCWTDLNF